MRVRSFFNLTQCPVFVSNMCQTISRVKFLNETNLSSPISIAKCDKSIMNPKKKALRIEYEKKVKGT